MTLSKRDTTVSRAESWAQIQSRMRRRRFWPGFRWRILAHKRVNAGRASLTSYVENGQVETRSEDFDQPVEFDELVIDHWFHLEQMSDRSWWIGLGTYESEHYMINVTINAKGEATVSVERDDENA